MTLHGTIVTELTINYSTESQRARVARVARVARIDSPAGSWTICDADQRRARRYSGRGRRLAV